MALDFASAKAWRICIAAYAKRLWVFTRLLTGRPGNSLGFAYTNLLSWYRVGLCY